MGVNSNDTIPLVYIHFTTTRSVTHEVCCIKYTQHNKREHDDLCTEIRNPKINIISTPIKYFISFPPTYIAPFPPHNTDLIRHLTPCTAVGQNTSCKIVKSGKDVQNS